MTQGALRQGRRVGADHDAWTVCQFLHPLGRPSRRGHTLGGGRWLLSIDHENDQLGVSLGDASSGLLVSQTLRFRVEHSHVIVMTAHIFRDEARPNRRLDRRMLLT